MLIISDQYKSLMGGHWIYVFDKKTGKEICRYRRLNASSYFWERILETLENKGEKAAMELYTKYRGEGIPIFIIWR